MGKPPADPGMNCPLHRKDVSRVCHKCAWYIQVRGMNPQTGQEVDRWDCSIAFQPLLMIENSNMQRQTGAAVESLRNSMVRIAISAPTVPPAPQRLSSQPPVLDFTPSLEEASQ